MPLTNGSTPMKPMRGMRLGLGDQMLAAAESDLEPHASTGTGNKEAQVAGGGAVEIERQPRQQRLEQRRLRGRTDDLCAGRRTRATASRCHRAP